MEREAHTLVIVMLVYILLITRLILSIAELHRGSSLLVQSRYLVFE